MAAGDRQETKFRKSCWELRRARRNVQLTSNSFSAVMLAMGQITAVIVLYISGNEVLAGTISIGSALTLRLLAETATAPFSVLGDQYSNLITATVSWKRLEQPFAIPVLPPSRRRRARVPAARRRHRVRPRRLLISAHRPPGVERRDVLASRPAASPRWSA